MIDMRSSPPNELVRFADVMTKLMVQLPDLLPRERRQYEKTGDLGGMDDHALMHNWKRCIAGDPDAVWVDRRVPFVQTLADRLIALATDGSRAAGAVIDRLLTGIIGQARVPLVTHFQSQPVAGETADEAYARLMGDDDVDDAPTLRPASRRRTHGHAPRTACRHEAISGARRPHPGTPRLHRGARAFHRGRTVRVPAAWRQHPDGGAAVTMPDPDHHHTPAALNLVEDALATSTHGSDRHIHLMRVWQRLWDACCPPSRDWSQVILMIPCHPLWPEFVQRLASALNISPCRHEPDFPRTVPILREMGLDLSSSLQWFHGWGMQCDCAILGRGDDD